MNRNQSAKSSTAALPLHEPRCTYRWHHHLSLEASADSVVDTLWLSPAGIDTHVGVRLMSVEALRAYKPIPSAFHSAFDLSVHRPLSI